MDIIFKGKDFVYHFSWLEWDTQFFNRPSYMLDIAESNMRELDRNMISLLGDRLKGCFVTAKIETNLPHNIIKSLLDAGFYYVETEVTLKMDNNKSQPCVKSKTNDSIVVEKLTINAGLPYQEFGSAFSYTRFHTDPYIKTPKANDLWTRYLKSYSPDENHHLICARYKGETAGIILANQTEGQVMLFFVAVLNRFSRKGVGVALMDYVKDCFKNKPVTTGTQIKNIPALNYYINNGFSKIISTKTILHYWG